MAEQIAPPKAFAAHNHQICSGSLLKRADVMAQSTGFRLTPVRRRTLEILLEEHRAYGAYEVLARLASDGFGDQPPVAYRALDFLVAHGLAHRIRRLNAFAACADPGDAHVPLFLICTDCGALAESAASAMPEQITQVAERARFTIERANIEVAGLCPNCAGAAECH